MAEVDEELESMHSRMDQGLETVRRNDEVSGDMLRMATVTSEVEKVKDSGEAEQCKLEAILTHLEQQVADEKSLCRTEQTSKKAPVENLASACGICKGKLTGVLLDPENKHSHVAGIEQNVTAATGGQMASSPMSGARAQDSHAETPKLAEEVAAAMQENAKERMAKLRGVVTNAQHSKPSSCGGDKEGDGRSKSEQLREVLALRGALEDAYMRLIQLQESRDDAEKVCKRNLKLCPILDKARRHSVRRQRSL